MNGELYGETKNTLAKNALAKHEVTKNLPTRSDAAATRACVCIGASTGGVIALQELLGALPPDFPAAILIVQHHPAGLTATLVAQLARTTKLVVREARANDKLLPGVALIAPGNCDLTLNFAGDVRLGEARSKAHIRYSPSIDAAMRAVAQVSGAASCGVVLSGMGDDGAAGLKEIKTRGGRAFVQEVESCVAGSMPQQARLHASVDHVASLGEIALLLQIYVAVYRWN